METTHNTPFKLPIWSIWTVQTNERTGSICSVCRSVIPSLKILAIQSLLKHLRSACRIHDLSRILQENLIPPILYVDVARQLFLTKQWSVLRSLVSHWPFDTFQLSQICNETCPQCWLAYLETDDVDDPEKEGGDTERQLFRKVFKHVLDGYFFVVKGTLENGYHSPLRVLDLTLDSSQDIRGFLWEDEFRRLGRRVTKTLDVCVLAGMHKQGKNQPKPIRAHHAQHVDHQAIDHWMSDQQHEVPTMKLSEGPAFEISTWNDEDPSKSAAGLEVNGVQEVTNGWSCSPESHPEIGVWNGNALDLSHLKEMPVFSVIIDASISEKSTDILTWIQHRYDDFSPSPSPLSVTFRFLEVSLHEERKFDALVARLPEQIHGLQLAEICERKSALTLALQLSRFHSVRFLDFGACAFDLADQPQTVESMAFSLSQLARLERLSLAHNCLTGCLSDLLSPLQHGLKLLDLSSCSLNDDDLAYLGESVHRSTLKSLSLASNDLGTHWDRLQLLITQLGCSTFASYGSTLRILDLSSNEFVESQLTALCRAMLGPLSSLSLLDLSWHEMTFSSVVSVIELLASRTSLRTFCLSTPTDMSDCGYGQPDSWQVFVDFFRNLTDRHRLTDHRPPLTLHWCLM